MIMIVIIMMILMILMILMIIMIILSDTVSAGRGRDEQPACKQHQKAGTG